jgi:hypothetical protein
MKMNIRRLAMTALLVIGMTFPMLMTSASPASATTVGGCAQGWSQWPGTCIQVVTGSKNFSNGTQYVRSITVSAPREARVYNRPGTIEAWAGNGPTGVAWYRSTHGLTVTWTIDRWIKNGSGICGAFGPWSGGRSIACITIRV